MIKTTLKSNGMMCSMCEAHICDTIRKAIPEAKRGLRPVSKTIDMFTRNRIHKIQGELDRRFFPMGKDLLL